MTEPIAETRPVEEAAPAEETTTDETIKASTTEEVKAETGTETPTVAQADLELEDDDDIKSKKVTLADLSAKGTALYAHKKYEAAADIFSRASILQAEINGELAPENAEILFHYGRSLFKVGQSKSDVLGGSAPAPAEKKTKSGSGASSKKATKADEGEGAQEGGAEQGKDKKNEEKDDVPEGKKLFFQFTGDENFDESDEDEGQEEGDQDEEEDDDLATAFEILELARVCYQKQLDQLREEEAQGEDESKGKGKEVAKEDSSAVRHIKERLAETHDCLAEISLENERYPNAIEDGRTSLNYKVELYPEESEIIAEAHYKLSLALEFASLTVADDEGKNTKREEIDQGLRDEAVAEMELAIKSFKLKMQAIEVEIASSASPEDNELSRKAVEEMKEVIAELEQRLVDLKKDPLSANDLLGDGANPLGGILGAAFGQSAAEVQARVEEASKNAVDLTSLVRKKKAKDDDAVNGSGNTKRKADEESSELEMKRTKVDEEEQTAEADK
ncbi:SHNi-TPR domain-containing protein [Trichoderma breve]|uniref:SHNi-TPR domain-containing protein n=1 Tax=Trichoderma breve TaxID=2034170 RepID=A0A9W9JSE8_9HYPO|nr:SHNi-TPR domain-containing protein [Trichoderma breve]KAJ4864332.1 SHNi-TPR domain-containing protein [Trichoderma breve]